MSAMIGDNREHFDARVAPAMVFVDILLNVFEVHLGRFDRHEDAVVSLHFVVHHGHEVNIGRYLYRSCKFILE